MFTSRYTRQQLTKVEITKFYCINIFNFQGTSCYCFLDSITAHNGIVDVSKTILENSCLNHETSYMKVYKVLKRKYKEVFYIKILLHRVMSTLQCDINVCHESGGCHALYMEDIKDCVQQFLKRQPAAVLKEQYICVSLQNKIVCYFLFYWWQ